MKRSIGLTILAIILAVCLTAGGILYIYLSPPNPTSSTLLPVGICVHSLSQTDSDLIADTGAQWIRIDISDNETELTRSLTNAKAHNLSVLGILDSWMFNQSCEFTLNQWNRSVTYNVTKYAPYVDAWEIWNEPTSNISGWQIQVDYLSVVQIASPIIRQNDPTATIILFGGLQLYTGGPYTAHQLVDDKEFARNLSTLHIAEYGDAISLHAYPWGKEFTDAVRDSYTASLEYYSGLFNQSLDIWVTETGQNITTSGEFEQAEYLSEALDYFNNTSVSHVFWYALNDENKTRGDFGLIGANMHPRQSYTTLQDKIGS